MFLEDATTTKRLQCIVPTPPHQTNNNQSEFVFSESKRKDELPAVGERITVHGTLVKGRGKTAVELHVDDWAFAGRSPQQRQQEEAAANAAQIDEATADRSRDVAASSSLTSQRTAALSRLRAAFDLAFRLRLADEGATAVTVPVLTRVDTEAGGGGTPFRLDAVGQHFFAPQSAHSARAKEAQPPTPAAPPVSLTVSSQLHLEPLAASLGSVFSIAPQFRAEASHGARHLAEFTMLEYEQTLLGEADVRAGGSVVMRQLELLLSSVVHGVAARPGVDVDWDYVAGDEGDTRHRAVELYATTDGECWPRITFAEAVQTLGLPATTNDLSRPAEARLVDEVGGGVRPVFVTDWPAATKPPYMLQSEDGDTVDCFDLLVPGVGELAGGSAREYRHARIGQNGLLPHWYRTLRLTHGIPTAGYGIGFDRLVASALGGNVSLKDVVPIPRSANSFVL